MTCYNLAVVCLGFILLGNYKNENGREGKSSQQTTKTWIRLFPLDSLNRTRTNLVRFRLPGLKQPVAKRRDLSQTKNN